MEILNRSHSVRLDESKCLGCTTCIRTCPTEAIRVRNGKAYILDHKCIDCGVCIRTCPERAKRAVFDPLERMQEFRYTVALPAPTLYGQYNNLDDVDVVLTALLRMGFDAVCEVAGAAEMVSDYTRRLLESGTFQGPVISSACPVVVRLIRNRFPDLCDRVLPVRAPVHVAATLARKEAVEKTGLKPEEIGVFFISPCPAKVTDAYEPVGFEKSDIDGVFSIADVYKPLLEQMNKLKGTEDLTRAGLLGIGWAVSGGEAAGLLKEKYVAVDGIQNVIKVLEELENERLTDLSFIELNACPGGCVGGACVVENPFVAKARMTQLRKGLPVSRQKYDENKSGPMKWDDELSYRSDQTLDKDMGAALQKARRIQEIRAHLPGLDCGACGAPSCKALAKDIVAGYARESDCLFVLKQLLATLYEQSTGGILPNR